MFAPDENGNTIQPVITIKQTDDTDSVNRATVKAGTVYSYCTVYISQKKDKDRREGKGRRCWLGDVLECRTNHLAVMMI